MLRKCCYCFLVLSITFNSAKAVSIIKSSLSDIFQIKDKCLKEKQFISYIRNYFQAVPLKDLNSSKSEVNTFLSKSAFESKDALVYVTESIYQDRLSHDKESKTAMIGAIQSAAKYKDHYLLCSFLNFLAYKQTEDGDVIGAVTSYRMAKKEAIKLGDANLQMIIDVNVSDVFYKNNFYSQSLFYLDQAQTIATQLWPNDRRIKNVIFYNKAENFFRMNMPDSLLVYNKALRNSSANTEKLYTYKKRTDYYLLLLHHDYNRAIEFDDQDLQNLSDAFYRNGQTDSAKLIVNQLLSKSSTANHPEIKSHLYDVLGKIAEQLKDYKSASDYFKLSLQQSGEIMNRLTRVDNISSLIKVDELEGYFSQKKATYEKERLWLIFLIILAILIILVVAMFYRAVKQKRLYEKLLFASQKNELAFLNSHDVRKHLMNILGLIEVIKHSKNKGKGYVQVEDHLFCSANELDKAIKNISEKLDN
jgi:hypothetical protein